MNEDRYYVLKFSEVYPMYIKKVERKGHTKDEVDQVITWLTGYSLSDIDDHMNKASTFKTFFDEAPKLNDNRQLIKGVICGLRVEEIKDDLVQNIRYLDKLVDEIAKGKKIEKILRK